MGTAFHILRDPVSNRHYRGRIELGLADPFAVTRAEQIPERAVVHWAMGSRHPTDVIWTTSVAPIILSRAAGRSVESIVN